MRNNVKFDKSRYFYLLKKQEILKNEGNSLFNANEKEDIELLSYSVILESQIYYNRKYDYISLLENYLKKNSSRTGAELFVWKFFNIFKKDHETFRILEKEILQNGISKLATFFIDPKSKKFSSLINEIAGCCEFLTFDPTDTSGMNLDQFRALIEKIFFKIQKCLDE